MGKLKKDEKETKADSKESAIQRVIAQIEKQYGQGAIMQMDEHKYARIEGIPTGSLSLDIALGGHGVPGEELPSFSVRNLRAKPLSPCISSPTPSEKAA